MDGRNSPRDDYRKQPVRVGFYEIEETVGKGNFAVVKMARHRITKSRVAIKIIDKSRLDETNLKKVYREVQIMKLLHHPHVLKLYQVMETTNMLYIVTEYAAKGEMFAFIDRQGKFSENEARKIFVQILSAVEYCHNVRVVHRDLKTENLLLDENGNVKIADFGFSNYTQENVLLKTWCGSPPYAAPEIFEGKEYHGPAIDIWSLGVCLYVLVCAALPFDGETVHEVRDRVLEGRFRVPYFMSRELEDLIRKILVKNPSQRYTLNQIKAHPWLRGHANTQYRPASPVTVPNTTDLNAQVLQLMQSLGIDLDKTKMSVAENKYDHYSAIYYLLNERLRQHRTSFPEQKNVGTRLRRASVMADQVIVKNNLVQELVGHQQLRLPSSAPRKNPQAALQYALNELSLGEVKTPHDIQVSAVPGCVREFIPPVSQPPQFASSRPTSFLPPTTTAQNIETVSEESEMSSSRGDMQVDSSRHPRQRSRRSAIDAMAQVQPNRRHTVQGSPAPAPIAGTLYVPANHPLLRQDEEQPPDLLRHPNSTLPNSTLPNGMRIEIIAPTIPPVEPMSASTMNFAPDGQKLGVPYSPFVHKTHLAFQEGRRASDGVNAPFKHLLHKMDNKKYLQEHQNLQKLYERSLTPEQIEHQQTAHSQFMSKTSQENCTNLLTVSEAREWGPVQTREWGYSPLSSQNELMSTLQSLHLQSQEMEIDNDLGFSGLGPHRRQASYRKLAGGPLPQHIRKRRTAVTGESPFLASLENSFDENSQDAD